MQEESKTTPKLTEIEKGRYQGIACGLACLSRDHLEQDLAKMVLETLDITPELLKFSGADEYDMEALNGI